MSRLKELTEYKNTIIERLVGNQNVCKAVYYQDRNFLDKPDVSPDQLIYENIYPYNFVLTSEESLKIKKTYITLSLTDFRSAGGVFFKAGYINIGVFCHKDLFRTDYGFLRTDFLVSEIDEMLNSKRGIGIGELQFVGMRELMINESYIGNTIQYRPVSSG